MRYTAVYISLGCALYIRCALSIEKYGILNDVERCRCDLIASTYRVSQLGKTTKNLGTVSVMAAIRTECLMNMH